jgi:hypothetical protein
MPMSVILLIAVRYRNNTLCGSYKKEMPLAGQTRSGANRSLVIVIKTSLILEKSFFGQLSNKERLLKIMFGSILLRLYHTKIKDRKIFAWFVESI